MTEQRAYDQLLEMTSSNPDFGKIDIRVFHMLSILDQGGNDVDECSIPMLALVRRGEGDKIKELATVFSVMETVVALRATPEQLIKLLQAPEVISLEVSGSVGGYE